MNDENLYAIAADDLAKGNVLPELKAKAFALSEGNKDKAHAIYIQLAVQRMKEVARQQDSEMARAAARRHVERAKAFVGTAFKKLAYTGLIITGVWLLYRLGEPPNPYAASQPQPAPYVPAGPQLEKSSPEADPNKLPLTDYLIDFLNTHTLAGKQAVLTHWRAAVMAQKAKAESPEEIASVALEINAYNKAQRECQQMQAAQAPRSFIDPPLF